MDARAKLFCEAAEVTGAGAPPGAVQRQQWLRAVLEASPTPSLVVDDAGRLLLANSRALTLLAQDASTLAMFEIGDVLATVDGKPLDVSGIRSLEHASTPPSVPILHARTGDGRTLRVEVTAAAFEGFETSLHVVALLDVTRREASESEREMLLQLLEQSTDFVGLADLDGRLLWLNEAARKMVGVDDCRGRNIADYVAPRCRDWYVGTFLPTVRANGGAEGEMTLVNLKTGEEIDVHRAAFTIRDPASGRPVGLGTVTRDVREQKVARQALEAERMRLQLALDAGGMGSWEWDPLTNRAIWNAREFDLAGMLPTADGAVDARAFFERIVPEDRASVEAALADAFTRGEEFVQEFRVQDPIRGRRWLAGQARLVPDGAGGVRMIGLNWDVTESHRREEELRHANERVHTSVELLSRAERAARVGAFIHRLDRDDSIVWSDTLYDILGVPKSQKPTPDVVFDMYTPAIAAVVRHAASDARRTGHPVEIEVPLRPGPNRADWVHLYLVPHLEDGRCVQVSGAVQDISARKRLEHEVVAAANAERERIGADLHDDLGQVLTSLSLQMHAHARDAQSDPKLAAQVEQLERTLQRAREACRRLARAYVAPVSVLGFGEMLLQLATDVPDTIRCMVHAQPLPQATGVGVAQELFRIAQEAVSNAIRHSRCTTISIDVEVADDRIELKVTDDGIGTTPDGRVGGVGLTTMRSRAARIGGMLTIEPPDGGGTRVRVTVARLD
jgi:PAS domain S-box-containing protein